jgi:hypothetical protein
MQGVAGDYFLVARGYNINLLEDASPYNFMNLKSFNSHEHDPSRYNPSAPPNPADLKTVVDAAVNQGKWFNLVLHTVNNDNGAIVYSLGKDIWLATGGAVTKYILQRDRTVISNYVETTNSVRFDAYRLPLDASSVRSFETALGPQDTLTFQVDFTGISSVSGATVNGAPVPFTWKTYGGKSYLLIDMPVTLTPQTVVFYTAAGANIGSALNPPLIITNISRLANRQVQLIASGTPQQRYWIQASTTPANWTTIATTTADASGRMVFVDSTATNYSSRFYRTVVP